ncbi:hypothetical protein [Insolitispirillum peregrinum]|uniref:Uncharacterized protein n=1 Tax=Insolitispirillum peregrinum TaxID=80876 RepID=A0A1N7IZK7_9PROT|nr:hypothetical protein [Insolitispirillum peregrinum]SIS42490.1 hypothetical protein SAMN05421779_101804 [Insolitispirillum peregrinum]
MASTAIASPLAVSIRGWRQRLLAIVTLLFGTLLLTSCYVPNDFVAEIRLARTGDYALTYKGTLTWAPLYKDIREGKLSSSEIAEREKGIINDLKRDSSFKEITPLGSGTFRVRYETSGKFTGTQAVTFVRRNSALLTVEIKPDGTVHIWCSQDPKLRDPTQLESLGLRTQGRLRVVTDLPVLKHNAFKVSDGPANYPAFKVYDWSINSVRTPKPLLIGQLFNPASLPKE